MNKYIYGLVIGGAVLATACEDDFLNQEPILKQSTELTMASLDGIKAATVGCYSPLSNCYWYGADLITHSEMRAGNARIPANTKYQSGRCTSQYNWDYNSGSTMGGIWRYGYYVIINASNIINNVDGKGNQSVVDGIKAEALFLRALSYFDLVRTYCQPYTQQDPNIPEMGVPVIVESHTGLPKRNTVAEVYALIESDLLQAEQLFPEDYNTQANYHTANIIDYKALASKEAVQALLSRVYLYMGQWQKAADYATKVISSGKFQMWTPANYASVWNKMTGGDEVIFEVFGDVSNDRYGEQGWEFIQWLSNHDERGSGDFAASHDIYDLYSDKDVRKTVFSNSELEPNQFWTLKYAGKDGSSPSYNNICVLRLSEMYLNRAEAQLRGASVDGTTADADMRVVSKNRGAAAEAATLMGCFIERRKELAFEGHIIYDFARYGLSIERVDTDSPVKSIPFPSNKWALPIPKSECDANPNMKQNPGY